MSNNIKENNILSQDFLFKLSNFISSRMGLNFPKEKLPDLERGIILASKEFNFDNTKDFVDWLTTSPIDQKHIEILSGYLTIGETYFYRDENYFEILENNILPKLISARRQSDKRIRIWSAGCSTGEEPYSIAMLLHKLIPDIKDWEITILASDINSKFLKKANEGIYTEWSFRNTPAWIRNNYFSHESNKRFKIIPSVKKMANFSYLNLADENYPSLINNTNAMDIIFCRNVLMYFIPELANNVVVNLSNSLVEGGWLIINPAEASFVPQDRFDGINFDNAIIYKRNTGKSTGANENNLSVSHIETKDEITDFNLKFKAWQNIENSTIGKLDKSIIENSSGGKTISDSLDLYMLAYELFKSGHYEDAEKHLLNIHSKDPLISRVQALLARIYANKGELNDAINWCEKAILNDKLNPALYYLQATILQELGNKKEAIRLLKQTLYLDHNFVMAHLALANLTMNNNQLAESKRYYRNALSILSAYPLDKILPYSEGITAGRLSEIINASNYKEGVI